MNYLELKNQIRDLGFSDDAEIDEFGAIIPNGVNRAITEINQTTLPNIGTYEFEQTGDVRDYLYYDLEELTAENGEVKFLGLTNETPIMVGERVYKAFNNFDLLNDKILVIDGKIKGKFKVFYKKAHTPFTEDTPDDTVVELPKRADILLPLLACYYIWLEDDRVKAVEYYNQFEKLQSELLSQKNKPRVRIMTGGI